jgi:glucose-1-phosphate thymidylyltransferase
MEIARALIMVGENGDRPRWPTSPPAPKTLFPIANRPILFHQLESLSAAGVLETVIVCEPAAHPAIREAVGDGRRWGMRVLHLEWLPGDGLAGALQAGRTALMDEPVLVQHGGSLMFERIHPHISAFAREDLDALAFRLSEPASGPDPGYLLSPSAVSLLSAWRGAAVNPVADLRARGGRVREQAVDACLPCHGDLSGVLESNRLVLEDLRPSFEPHSLRATKVQGPVKIHPSARVERSLLRGPLAIGAGARITDAYVGPYTSIGENVLIEGTELEYSIVLANAQLRFIGTRLDSSVIGRGARVARDFDVPGAMRMCVGDGAEVVIR